MTILDGCPPLKCVFFSFFLKSAFFLHGPWSLCGENHGFQPFFKTASGPVRNTIIADIAGKCESIHTPTMLFCEKSVKKRCVGRVNQPNISLDSPDSCRNSAYADLFTRSNDEKNGTGKKFSSDRPHGSRIQERFTPIQC
jgi:hypothetical protein